MMTPLLLSYHCMQCSSVPLQWQWASQTWAVFFPVLLGVGSAVARTCAEVVDPGVAVTEEELLSWRWRWTLPHRCMHMHALFVALTGL
ncbi:hypothetical protein GN244_ATG08438 [Phytophthora infestans]|uniref:Uncharacterized protein n=1 Tax=Phytophthora infestans TaxID=4787 RepID=A0A833WER6_PHYIN|nr:hypothetical protein GN244_ATG08438 [Phytophthora infestans]